MVIGLKLESGPDAASRAREELRCRLRDRLDERHLLDLQLIVSELVSNSVRYGPGGEIEIDLALAEDGLITGQVEDRGRGEVAIRENADGSGGFGLRIVDALAGNWGVYTGSTHVWFEIRPRDQG